MIKAGFLEKIEDRVRSSFVDDPTWDTNTVHGVLDIISEEKKLSEDSGVKVSEHLHGIILAVRNDTLCDVVEQIEKLIEQNGETKELLYLLEWIKKEE